MDDVRPWDVPGIWVYVRALERAQLWHWLPVAEGPRSACGLIGFAQHWHRRRSLPESQRCQDCRRAYEKAAHQARMLAPRAGDDQ